MNHFLTYRDTTLKVDNLKRVEISKSVSEESDKVVWWELMLMFFLLAISGNPYIGIKQFELFTVASVLITVAHILRNYKKSVSYRTIIIFVFLLGYEIMHAILFKLDYTFTFFKLAIILLLSTASVDILKHKFIDVLTKHSVVPVDPEGQPFDADLHQAVSMVPNAEVEPNTVINVFQKGYTLNGRLIRPAMVVVSTSA